jgi:GTP-binding protein EngB required for normal cell division
LVATKCDKVNATERKKSEEMLKTHPNIPTDTPIVFYSSLKGSGKAELWKLIADFTDIKL